MIDFNNWKKNVMYFIGAVLMIFLGFKSLELFGFYALKGGDAFAQHLAFFDVLRENFFVTHDFFPQFNHNLGMGSSYGYYFYHGLNNPFLLISYLVPFINTYNFILLVFSFLGVLNFVAIYNLMRIHNHEKKHAIYVALAMTMMSGIYHHLSVHYVFAYYIPFMSLNLIAINKMATKGKMVPFVLITSLGFYFNFFFAPIIGIVSFVYLLLFTDLFTKENKVNIKLLTKFIIGYILAILIGFFPLAVIYSMNDTREAGSLALNYFLEFNSLDKVMTTNTYSGYMPLFVIPAVVFGFLNPNKRIKLLSLFVLVAIVYCGFDYFVNIFQYLHYKFLLMLLPLFAILFAEFTKKLTPLKLVVISIVFVSTIFFTLGEELYSFVFILAAMMMYIMKYINFKYLIVSSVILVYGLIMVMYLAVGGRVLLVTPYEYLDQIYSDTNKDVIYQNTLPESASPNAVEGINEFHPTMYTSLVNYNYIQPFFDGIYPLQKNSKLAPKIAKEDFDTNFTKQFYAIENDINNKTFINGVSNEATAPVSQLMEENAYQNILELNSKLFVEDDNLKSKKKNSYEYEKNIKEKKISVKQTIEGFIHLDNEIPKDGSIILYTKATGKNGDGSYRISINESSNVVRSTSRYFRPKDDGYYIWDIDVDKGTKMIPYRISKGDYLLEDIHIAFISNEEMKNNQLDYYLPTNQEIIPNKGYKFSLTMEEDGYLNTTIPFADGFIITANGKEIDQEIVNNYYLGAKLEKGTYDIEITYQIPGYFIFLGVTITGIILTIGLYMFEKKKKKW